MKELWGQGFCPAAGPLAGAVRRMSHIAGPQPGGSPEGLTPLEHGGFF